MSIASYFVPHISHHSLLPEQCIATWTMAYTSFSYEGLQWELPNSQPHSAYTIQAMMNSAALWVPGQMLPAALLLVLVAVVLSTISRFLTRFRHLVEYPGPWIAAYTRLWICRVIASGNSAQLLVDVNQE